MKTVLWTVAMLLAVPTNEPSAQPAQPSPSIAQQVYQEGLYLQHTVGDLEQALAAYARALKEITGTEERGLAETIYLRRAECFKLLGRSAEQQNTIEALQKRVNPEEAALGPARSFPPESEVVLQLNLSALRKSPIFKEWNLEAEIDDKELKDLVPLLGFDPIKDLERLTVGVSFSDDQNMPAERWLIQAEGHLKGFNPKKFVESQKEELTNLGLAQKKIHGVDVLSVKVPLPQGGVGTMSLGIAHLDQTSFLLGDMKSIRAALAIRAGLAPGLRANPRLSKLASQVPPDADFWLAAIPNQILKKIGKIEQLPGLPKNLPQLEGLVITGRVTKDLDLNASAWAADSESAKLLGDIFRGLLALAQLMPIDEPLVKRLVGSLKVEIEDRKVKVLATLPGELLRPPKKAQQESKGKNKSGSGADRRGEKEIETPGTVKH